jgi:hypothetical protein
MTSTTSIRITESATTAAPTRARKQFNTLVKKLQAERERMVAWQEALPQLQQLTTQIFVPLLHEYDGYRKQIVLLFDKAYEHKSMGVRNKEKLEHAVCSMALELLEMREDAELEAILTKFDLGDPFVGPEEPPPQEISPASFKQTMEAMFGFELDSEDTPEALMATLEARFGERASEAEQQAKAARPKGAKARQAESAAHQRKEAELARMQLSVRELYRKLASALHPDREPDPQERLRKTVLMQRVNVAYEKNDLLGLLELQLEAEHIDQAGLDNLSEEHIAQYNAVLRGQVNELERDNFGIEYSVAMEWHFHLARRLTPQVALRQARQDLDELRALVDGTCRDLEAFQDIKHLKRWLKDYRIKDPGDFDDDWYF